MIKPRTLLLLAGITVVVVLGAVLSSSMRGYDKPEKDKESLLPDLTDHINDVAEIEITGADGKKIDLKRTGDGWGDASRGGFPAKFEPIKKLLVSFADAKIAEHKTSDPQNYKRLGVTNPEDADSKSSKVVLRDESGKSIASLIIGNRMSGGSGRFVRRNDDSEVLLTADQINASALPLSWLDREIMRIPRDDVKQVSIAHPNGDSFTIVRKPDGKFDLIGVPEGRRVRAQSPMSGIMNALAYVDFQDVKPIGDIDFDSLKQPLLATYQTKDGMEIDVSVWTDDKKKWTTYSISKVPGAGTDSTDSKAGASADDQSKKAASTGDKVTKKAGAPSDDKSATKTETVDDKIARLKKKVDGWVYEISPSSLMPLETSMIELTEEIPKGETSGPPAPSASSNTPAHAVPPSGSAPATPQAKPAGSGGG